MDVLGPKHEIKQNLQVKPRNWIPKSANVMLIEVNKTFTRIENMINGEDRFTDHDRPTHKKEKG